MKISKSSGIIKNSYDKSIPNHHRKDLRGCQERETWGKKANRESELDRGFRSPFRSKFSRVSEK
jgi:hypothetical protein